MFDRNSNWAEIDFSSVPVFHFFKKGALVHTVRGWPTDGRRPAGIIKGLAKLGITLE